MIPLWHSTLGRSTGRTDPPRRTALAGAPRGTLVVALALLAPVALVQACKAAPFDPVDAATSPQASAEPALLTNLPATATNPRADAGPPPEPLRTDRPLEPDSPREGVRELGGREAARDSRVDTKELSGYVLQAVVKTGEGPPAPKGGEVNGPAIDAARRKTEIRLSIEASQTRARFVFAGGLVVPAGTELRARVDRYGHIVLWPGESTYRIAEPGSLRALLGERRLDVAPLSPATVTAEVEGARRSDVSTAQRGQHVSLRSRRVDVTTRAARATLELATLRDAGEGGMLVCRMLLDLVNAPPSTSACGTDEVPIHAELRWTTQGLLAFDVVAITRRTDLPVQDLAAPPSTATFAAGPPPVSTGDAILARSDLAAFRTAPIDVPPDSNRETPEPAPEAGLVLLNSSDELRVAWIDGVAAAWVAPGGRLWLPWLVRGRYALQARTFLGDAWGPSKVVPAPGVRDLGAM